MTDTGAGTPLTALRSASLETVRRYWAGELTERQACDWFDVDRLTFRAALASLDAARSRPATEPAGLDVERLVAALAAVDDRIVAEYPEAAADLASATDEKGRRDYAEAVAAEYARLSVADGPGPE